MKVCKRFKFDAAHRLPNYDGVCSRLHGHTWFLDVEVEGPVDKNGFVMDFVRLKDVVNREVVSRLDHTFLNDTFENPTAELMLRRLWNTLLQAVGDESEGVVSLSRLRLYESPDSYAEVSRDD